MPGWSPALPGERAVRSKKAGGSHRWIEEENAGV